MNRSLIICCLFGLVGFNSCSTKVEPSKERSSLLASIDSLEKKMFDAKSMEMDKGMATREVQLYQDFAAKFPEDSLSPEFLFRSSDLSRALGDNVKAIDYLGQVCKKYPSFKKIPECLFLQGYYYQEFFNDTTQAKAFYVQLISKYPDHGFVDDAQALMQMFGKSEQDIINGFEKKAEEKKKI